MYVWLGGGPEQVPYHTILAIVHFPAPAPLTYFYTFRQGSRNYKKYRHSLDPWQAPMDRSGALV